MSPASKVYTKATTNQNRIRSGTRCGGPVQVRYLLLALYRLISTYIILLLQNLIRLLRMEQTQFSTVQVDLLPQHPAYLLLASIFLMTLVQAYRALAAMMM